MAFTLTSPAFGDRQPIPTRYARGGDNLSPFLEWRDPPPGTQSYALVVEDPDAPSGTFRHWAIYDIPPDRRQLAEGRSSKAQTEDLPQAFNDFGNQGYDGPAPPPGDPPHSYRFRLAALGVAHLDVPAEADAGEVWEAARNNMLAEAELTGVYGRA